MQGHKAEIVRYTRLEDDPGSTVSVVSALEWLTRHSDPAAFAAMDEESFGEPEIDPPLQPGVDFMHWDACKSRMLSALHAGDVTATGVSATDPSRGRRTIPSDFWESAQLGNANDAYSSSRDPYARAPEWTEVDVDKAGVLTLRRG